MTSIPWRDLLSSASEEGGSFEALPADEYEVVVTDAKAKVASTGRNMIEAKFRVESGPYKGRTLFNNFVIVPENSKSMGIFFRNMAALGLKSDYFKAEPAPPLEDAADSLVERRCRVRVSIRTWGGQERNEVDAVAPPISSGPPVTRSGGTGAPPPPPFSGEPPF